MTCSDRSEMMASSGQEGKSPDPANPVCTIAPYHSGADGPEPVPERRLGARCRCSAGLLIAVRPLFQSVAPGRSRWRVFLSGRREQ